jgi:putative FmdB family regulatory protein
VAQPAQHARPRHPNLLTTTVPTYDYQCRNCGRTIEVVHSMLEAGPTTCEVCGGDLRRVLHPTGIIFKGSGFYKTDSRSSSSASVSPGRAKPSHSDGKGSSAPDSSGAKSSSDTSSSTPASGASSSE